MQDHPTVGACCNLLVRSRLVSADEVRTLLPRWQAGAGKAVDDAEAFVRWLVDERYLTEYQAELLRRRRVDNFFLGEYKLLEIIGKGRMAGVFKGVHRLGDAVAVKVLPPSKAREPQAFGRFQREARLALKLDHPNVVRTLQAGDDRGLHFIVMEFLDGETLEDVLKQRGKLPAAEAIPLLHQALLGLQHLHEQDIVHRDLKPANLMLLSGSDGKAALKILDVGLGRALFDEGEPGAGAIQVTAQGEILGDPDYMAPEQADDSHSADMRADIYSLGCVFYHALTGQPPFPDSNPVRKLIRHHTEAPRPLKSFNVVVPDGFEIVLDKMLAKDRALRFATPEQAVRELRPFVGGKENVPVAIPVVEVTPVSNHPVPPPPPVPMRPGKSDASKPGEKRQTGLHLSRRDWTLVCIGAAGVGGAVIAGVALYRWMRGKREG
jgi:serine/threonine protein kinase